MNTDFISIDVPLSTAPTSPSLDAAGSSRTHPNSNEIEPTWASPSTTFVIAQVIKAVVVFIGRLWVAYLFISLLYMMVHQIPTSISNPLSPNEHPAIGYHLKVLNSDVRMRVTRIYGIPALFGSSLKRPLYAPLLLLKGIDGCHSFETNFPNTSLLMNAVTSMDPDWNRVVSEAQNATLDLPWIGMMPRGGCPFDTKVFNIQQSGFKGAIIYNDETLPYSQNRPDIGIRMATFLKGDQVEILAMFLRRFDSSQLLEALRQAKSDPPILILKIAPADWNYRIGNVSLSDLLQDMIAFLIDLSLFACTFLGGCFGLALLRNVMVYHRLMLVETLISGSDFLLSSDTIVYPAPKLVSIPFPKRILGPGDITSMNDDTPSIASSRKISNTCCAVCIEDYEEGDTVRDLPCGHIYHAGW